MQQLAVKSLGQREYAGVFQAMKDYTQNRSGSQDDVLWLVEHYPVFTQGLAGKTEHLLATGDIPVVQIDRGGQVTYHGLGQAVIYLLLDIKAAQLGIRPLVSMIENATIATLANYGIAAQARADAPGVYVQDGRKIASLGLKVSRGCTYHGVAINVDMDLSPFSRINPCGLQGMKMAQVSEWQATDVASFSQQWVAAFSPLWFAAQAVK